MSFKVPVIDLDLVSGEEEELCGLLKDILVNHDTFLLKNYANKAKLDNEVSQLGPVDVTQGFDSNFTGALQLEESILLEQYILTSDTAHFKFDRSIRDPALKKVYSRLLKVVLYFTQLCLRSLNIDPAGKVVVVDDSVHSTKLTRFYHDIDVSNTVLPDGSNFEYEFETAEYIMQKDMGLLTVIPVAQGVRVKPATIGTDENNWVSIEEPDCLLLHTGELMAKLSNSMHTTSPIQVNPQRNVIQLTLFPSFTMDVGNKTVAQLLLDQEILDFEKVSAEYYPREYAILKLKDQVDFLKNLFSVSETVISLYAMSRSTSVPPGLHLILPQITNMMKRKVTTDDFLRIITIWSAAYEVDLNSNGDLTVKIPKRDPLAMLTNSSRKLDFVKKLEQWYANAISMKTVPSSVPVFKINKRRGSDGKNSMEPYSKNKDTNNKLSNTSKTTPANYLNNPKEKFEYKEKPYDSQENLLQRLREKERRSAALLSQRKNKYEQFLTVKMKQVFEIMFSLRWKEPYTSSYLTTLIVDSMQSSNNPIGLEEAQDILERLERLLGDSLIVHTVEGGLKVYRWESLDKDLFYQALEKFKTQSSASMDIDM